MFCQAFHRRQSLYRMKNPGLQCAIGLVRTFYKTPLVPLSNDHSSKWGWIIIACLSTWAFIKCQTPTSKIQNHPKLNHHHRPKMTCIHRGCFYTGLSQSRWITLNSLLLHPSACKQRKRWATVLVFSYCIFFLHSNMLRNIIFTVSHTSTVRMRKGPDRFADLN